MHRYSTGWNIPASKLTEVCLCLTGLSHPNRFIYFFKVAVMLVTVCQTFISLCLHWNDKTGIFRVANDFNAVIYGTCLVITFGFNNHNKINELFLLLKKGLFKYSFCITSSQKEAKTAEMVKIKAVEKLFVVSSILGTFTFFMSPMIFGLKSCLEGKFVNLTLPLSPWHPFQINSTALYLCSYLFEFNIALIVVIYHISWQSSLYTTILCLQGEMKILALAFSNLEATATEMMHNNKSHAGKDLSYYMELCLKECIQHHQVIIKCVHLLNDAFKVIIFEYLQSCTCIFCLNAMRLALEPLELSVTTVTSLGEIMPVLLQLWLICWFGQLLTNEGYRVGESCMRSEWINQSSKYKRTLLIVISCCNRPLRLKSGIYIINMQTYSQILQAAYSYLNFLLSTHDRYK